SYMKQLRPIVMLAAIMSHFLSVAAFETDQFNLPPAPLADISEEVEEYLEGQLKASVEAINAAIAKSESCIEAKAKGCRDLKEEQKQLAALRSSEAVGLAFYERVGEGDLFTTKFGKWMNSHE